MARPSPRPLYARIAEGLTEQIRSGALRPGDRAPSLRRSGRQHRVSMATAIQAYRWLETRGYLEARPRSGYFVRTPLAEQIPEPAADAARPRAPVPLTHSILRDVMAAMNDPAH